MRGALLTLTDLLQTRAQVAAEHEANPVDFHAMDAGLGVTLLHPLQVGFLLEERSGHCQVSTCCVLLGAMRRAFLMTGLLIIRP